MTETKEESEKREKRGTRASVGQMCVMFATSIGVPFERVLQKVGVKVEQLMDQEGRLPKEVFLKLFLLLEKAYPGKNASLKLASVLPESFSGALGRLTIKAPDLRGMMELLQQGQDLLSDQLDIELIDSDHEVMLKMHHELDDLDAGFGAELGLGLSTRSVMNYFGEDLIARVQFRHSARAELEVYEEYFKAPVEFETDYNGLVFRQEVMAEPNKKPEVEPMIVLCQRLDELRRETGVAEEDGLADIREAIKRNAMRGDYTVAGLASALALSPRTLQRRIQQSGSNARMLIEDIRFDYAMELLADASIPIQQVGERLGFDSERGFRRAFERRMGKSPAQARKERVNTVKVDSSKVG